MTIVTDEIYELLRNEVTRLRAKALFGRPGDSVSIRIPGHEKLLIAASDTEELRPVRFDHEGNDPGGFHAAIYRTRKDAGAVLIGSTPWSAALASLERALPVLFDEQARHIGETGHPVPLGRRSLALRTLRRGGNVTLYGDRRICVGTTPNRVVLNADLFEKCCKAFVIAYASGDRIHEVPALVRYIARGRLEKDKQRAAASYEQGRIPEGMDAY